MIATSSEVGNPNSDLIDGYWQVAIKFQVPPSCEIPILITSLVSRLGVKPDKNGIGSDMILRAWDRLLGLAF